MTDALQKRREFDFATLSMTDVLVEMAEGNVGAVTVLARLANGEADGSFMDALHLDDMNIRGSQVWVAYKDFAKEDFAVFVNAVRQRDPAMIRVVNDEGMRGNHPHRAVVSGASFGNRPTLVYPDTEHTNG